MSINLSDGLKMFARRKQRTGKVFQMVVAYFVLANMILISLPRIATAQTADDSLKMVVSKTPLKIKPNQKAAKMSNELETELFSKERKTKTAGVKAKAADNSEKPYEFLQIEFASAVARKAVFTDLKKSSIPNVFVITTIDRFADVYIPLNAKGDSLFYDTPNPMGILKNNPNIVWIESGGIVVAPPPPSGTPATLQSQATPEGIVRGGHSGLTGKNVIVAVIDSGIDFRHPDFMTTDAQGRPTSRIAYLWDTATPFQTGRGSKAPISFPNGTSIGTLYTKDQLTNELRSSAKTFPATDLDGHGTACASVAAGNGNADKQTGGLNRTGVKGVAPEADIIGIRLGYDSLENAYLLNAMVEWLDKVAGKTPLVISGSFGGHINGHDGQSIDERELNARLPLTKVGRSIVFAAGNEGTDKIHSKISFAKEPQQVVWQAERETVISIYFDSADPNIVVHGTQATPITAKDVLERNALTKQTFMKLKVKAGLGAIWLANSAGKATEAHLYFTSEGNGKFSPKFTSYSHLVGSPGTMENAITVGSYDWNDNFQLAVGLRNFNSVCDDGTGKAMAIQIGGLSCYSSPGPTRTGSVKPDIVAPGQWYASALAKNNGQSVVNDPNKTKVDSTGMYRRMNGTSAATPYTAGVIALMFQKKPTLTLGEVKNLIKGKASKSGLNPFTEAIPNKNWGYGKLDMTAINQILAAIQ